MSLSNAIPTKLRCDDDATDRSLTQLLSSIFLPRTGGILPAFVAMVNQSDQRPSIFPKNAHQLQNLLEGDDTEIFEIDRSNLVFQLRTLRRAINESAEEMEMIADEAVFAKSVSQALTRTARKMYRACEDLNALHRMLQQARPPAAPGRPPREPTPRNRRKTRD
jgi:hypothetical protein